jgi:hypothetical protein
MTSPSNIEIFMAAPWTEVCADILFAVEGH